MADDAEDYGGYEDLDDADDADDFDVDEIGEEELGEDEVYEEGHGNASQIITDPSAAGAPVLRGPERLTSPYMTKFEKARILGARALQISMNAPLAIPAHDGSDPLMLAEAELQANKIPFIVRRWLPNRTYEDWKVSELKQDDWN